jgi:myo-inositol-1(or 4)-monophosphatase
MNSEHEELRQQLRSWMTSAGELACDWFGRTHAWRKEDRSPVTEADHAVQELLCARIAEAFPGDAVITEESQERPERHAAIPRARRCWVIDPIDGTRNYERSIPVFTISVAVMEAGHPVVGVVHDPMARRTYSAIAGGGAWLGDEPVLLTDSPEGDRLMITIPTSRHEELPPVIHDWIDRMVVRNLGSTALHLVLLATGAVDAVYCRKSKLWDIAAGALMAMETGADLRSFEGRPYFPIDLKAYDRVPMPFIAARPVVLDRLLSEYRQAIAGG